MEKITVDLREVYKSIVARKRWLGDEMGRAENKLEKLEKIMKLSHPESMALRREAWEYVKIEEMV